MEEAFFSEQLISYERDFANSGKDDTEVTTKMYLSKLSRAIKHVSTTKNSSRFDLFGKQNHENFGQY